MLNGANHLRHSCVMKSPSMAQNQTVAAPLQKQPLAALGRGATSANRGARPPPERA
jgi:hypothetical protein